MKTKYYYLKFLLIVGLLLLTACFSGNSEKENNGVLYLIGDFGYHYGFGSKIRIVNQKMEPVGDELYGNAHYITDLTDNTLIAITVSLGNDPDNSASYNFEMTGMMIYLNDGTRLEDFSGFQKISSYAYNGFIVASDDNDHNARLYDLNKREFVTEYYDFLRMIDADTIIAKNKDGKKMILNYQEEIIEPTPVTLGWINEDYFAQSSWMEKGLPTVDPTVSAINRHDGDLGLYLDTRRGDYVLASLVTVPGEWYNDIWLLVNVKTGEEILIPGMQYYVIPFDNFYFCLSDGRSMIIKVADPHHPLIISDHTYGSFPQPVGELCFFSDFKDGEFYNLFFDSQGDLLENINDPDLLTGIISLIPTAYQLDLSVKDYPTNYLLANNKVYRVTDKIEYLAEGFWEIIAVTPDDKYFIVDNYENYGFKDMNMQWVYKVAHYQGLQD